MPLMVVAMTGAIVCMLTWALSTPAQGHEGGITANPLFTTARFDQRHPLTATEATRLTSHRFGFHPVGSQRLSSIRRHWVMQVDLHTPASLYCLACAVESHKALVALDLGCTRRMPATMRSASKVNQSRQRWKHKATSRADDHRSLRKERERLKRERDA